MINTELPGWQEAHDHAGELAKALHALGVAAIVRKPHGHPYHPCIEIAAGWRQLLPLTECIYLAADVTGTWWFWWSSLKPIAPAAQADLAADIVARAMPGAGTGGDQ